MIREATLHHPARDKKEKTSNNFLKSPLCGCEQSCSGRRGRIAICCIIEYCFLQYIRKYIQQIYKDNPVHANISSVFYPPLTFLVRFSWLLPDKTKTSIRFKAESLSVQTSSSGPGWFGLELTTDRHLTNAGSQLQLSDNTTPGRQQYRFIR